MSAATPSDPATTTGPTATPPSVPGRSDVVGTVVLGAVGLFAVVVGSRYGVWPDGAVGAGFLPVVTGGFILSSSLVEGFRLTRARRRAAPRPTTATEPGAPAARDHFGRDERQRTRATVLVFVAVGIALLLVPVVGLLLSLTLLVFALLFAVERKPLILAATGALVSLGVAWTVFVLLLAIPLPRGVLDLL